MLDTGWWLRYSRQHNVRHAEQRKEGLNFVIFCSAAAIDILAQDQSPSIQ